MQVEEVFIWEKKRKKNWRISPLDDYYYQSSSSVANQNAGFALVHWLGDTYDRQCPREIVPRDQSTNDEKGKFSGEL